MIELTAVPVDDPRLQRLAQLYLHEWSGLVPTAIGEDGLYHYAELARYRDTAAREVFLFLDDAPSIPIGFALTRRDDDGRWHVEDFFVIAGVRRRGLGAVAARSLFAIHAGPWTLTVRPENPRALAFWRAACPAAATEVLEPGADGIVRTRFSFT